MTNLLLTCIPTGLQVDSDDDGYVVSVPVLSGVDGFRFVTLDVRLDPMPYDHPDTFEFSYCFTVADLDGADLSYSTQDRDDVERYFDGNSREYVLPTVCACIEELVAAIEPNYIYRVTKGRDLPQKGLVKHFMVADAFMELGYREVQTGTDRLDRMFWLMSR